MGRSYVDKKWFRREDERGWKKEMQCGHVRGVGMDEIACGAIIS